MESQRPRSLTLAEMLTPSIACLRRCRYRHMPLVIPGHASVTERNGTIPRHVARNASPLHAGVNADLNAMCCTCLTVKLSVYSDDAIVHPA
jgi:hypothetical protein